MNQLKQLENFGTIIVADTGDLDKIKELKPHDATTNPSLVLKAIHEKNKNLKSVNEISVDIGTKISEFIPGYISTEVNPSKSYDTQGTINEAEEIIRLYQNNNVDTNRILIKIAATWEGILAAKYLENKGIKCNMTLIFSLTQARACAEAGVTLISPFVGRISDWYKENNIETQTDPGVDSVVEIYSYFKKYNYSTIVMGASFRNTNQITSLAGCDRLTISPKLIEELKLNNQKIVSKINKNIEILDTKPEPVSLEQFNKEMEQNKMANDKLKQGIEKFITDTKALLKNQN